MTETTDDPRTLAREAEATRDPALWVRAATALLRHERWDEAGLALVHARALGGEALAATVDERFGEGALDRLAWRQLASIPYSTRIAWAADGSRVFTANWRRGEVREVSLDGRVRDLVRVDRDVECLATDRAGRWVVAVHHRAGYSTPRTLDAIELATGMRVSSLVQRLGPQEIRAMTLWADERRLITHTFERSSTVAFDPEKGTFGDEPLAVFDRSSTAVSFLADDGRTIDFPPDAPRHQPWGNLFPHRSHAPTAIALERLIARFPGWESPFGKVRRQASELALSCGRLAAVANAHELIVLDVPSGATRTFRLPWTSFGLAFSPSGRRLALAGYRHDGKGGVILLEPDEGVGPEIEDAWESDRSALLQRLARDHRPSVQEWLLRKLEAGDAVPGVVACLVRRRDPIDRARLERLRGPEVAWLATVLEGAARWKTCNCDLDFRTAERHGELEEAPVEGLQQCKVCNRRFRIVGLDVPAEEVPWPEEREPAY